MNTPKYRVTYKVGRIEFSSPCYSEIEVFQLLQSTDIDSYVLEQYAEKPVKVNGFDRLQLDKITPKKLMENLIKVTFKKGEIV